MYSIFRILIILYRAIKYVISLIPDECQLRDRKHKITHGDCTSIVEISYQYCQGSCSTGSSDTQLLFPAENESDQSLIAIQDCECCRGKRVLSFKVKGYTFRGSNSVISIFTSFLKRHLLLMERICSSWSKFFPLGVNPILEGQFQLRKQTGSHESCFPW